jgi:hypothetical protein
MIDPVIAALSAACRTTMIAMTLFIAVCALSTVWDSAIYVRALHEALTQNPLG